MEKIVSGVIDRTIFSDEDGELIKVLDKELGREVTFDTIRNAYALGTKYLTNRGITISVGDLECNKRVLEEKDKIIKSCRKENRRSH